jgi:hypothetical protein
VSDTAADPARRQPQKPVWERLAAPATVLGLFVAAGGLLFTGLQLKVANDQSKQSADATELQTFGNLNGQISDLVQSKAFEVAARHLLSVASNPHRRSQFTFGDEQTIISLSNQYDRLAKLFLLDGAVLPHATQLFASGMACVLLDYEAIRTKAVGLHVYQLESLTAFTRDARCPSQATVNGVTIGFP